MKIAVLSSHTPSLFWFRLDMMIEFIESGYEVIAIGNEPECKWNDDFKKYGIRYRQIFVSRNSVNPFSDLKTLRSLVNVLKREKADKLFCYQAKTVIYGSLAANHLGIKEIYPLIAGLGSMFYQNNLKSNIVRRVLISEYRLALKNSKTVFFQNRHDSDVFVRNKIVRQEKIVYLNGSGVNIEKFTPTPLPEKPTFLNISRIIVDKGIREYLNACRRVKKIHPEYRCLLVGPFDTNPSALKKEELDEYISDGTIEYFGEQSDVRPFINQSSVVVLPSYHEGTPKVLLEAMSSARAIITTDAPGCRETVEDGKNGFLVPVKDIEILSEKMLQLAADMELAEKMGIEGRKIAEQKFSVTKINHQIKETMNL